MPVLSFDGHRWRTASDFDAHAGAGSHTGVRSFSAAGTPDTADSAGEAGFPGADGTSPVRQSSPVVGYMFFREHHPDRASLSLGLVEAKDCRAYCCQCSWTAVCPHATRDAPDDGAADEPEAEDGDWDADLGGEAGARFVQLRSAVGAVSDAGVALRGEGGGGSWRCKGHM